MSIKVKTLFFRILNSFILIIFLTVFLSTGIEFFSIRKELPVLLTEVRTKNIAHILGSAYSQRKGWDSLTDEILWMGEDNTSRDNIPSTRIIIRDSSGKTLYNSFSSVSLTLDSPLIEGGSFPILDYESGEIVGKVTAYIDKHYLDRETFDYIISLFYFRLLQGGITVLIAVLASSILARRITRPITALTRAAEVISLNEKASLLSVESQDELGRMSKSFNRMIHSLELQRELRKRLISDVSHEILSPLNRIRLEARGLLDGITLPGQGSPRIIEEVDHMKDLISDLDWLAETDSGEYHLKKEDLKLDVLISKEVESWVLKGQIDDCELILQDFPRNLPLFNVDVVRFSQALGNLIENALKYGRSKSPVEISCSLEDDFAVISVKNYGEGIALEDQPYLFERFYRADSARTPNKGGRGLGLAIVKQIVELHGGSVWFTSRINFGSTFFISIPYRNN